MFTGRFNHQPTEVLFDAICRENGIEHLLTQLRNPTTTGKIERFHRSMRVYVILDRKTRTEACIEKISGFSSSLSSDLVDMLTAIEPIRIQTSRCTTGCEIAPDDPPQRNGCSV